MSDKPKLEARPATFTCDQEYGNLYYFAVADRTKPPYLTQRHVNAIVDIASDGTLAGVELIDDMPPPPAMTPTDNLEAGAGDLVAQKLLKSIDRGMDYAGTLTADEYWDEGPSGEGWQSAELSAKIEAAHAALSPQ